MILDAKISTLNLKRILGLHFRPYTEEGVPRPVPYPTPILHFKARGFACERCLTLCSCRCSRSCQSPVVISVGFRFAIVFSVSLRSVQIQSTLPEFPVILREPEVLLLHEHVHDIVLGTASGISHCRTPSSCIYLFIYLT